jgi:chorismate synthase
LELTETDIQSDLDRRRPGQNRLVSQRKESDRVRILSGVFSGKTLGTPIALLIPNEDARPDDYRDIEIAYRPSHADFTYEAKYGIRNWQGGGRASARETAGRVAAGAIAKKLLRVRWGVEIVGWVSKVGKLSIDCDPNLVSFEEVEKSIVRCPDPEIAQQMIETIEQVRKMGNSIGGCISCVARGVPAGWGCPVFDKLEADLAKGMLSLPASKGFEIGSGFGGTELTGLEHNDEYYLEGELVQTRTNRSGGVQGGISNGEMIHFRVAFKPTATVMHDQQTVTANPLGNPGFTRKETIIKGRGRHDPCVLPRAVPMVEAMCALVLVDHAMRQAAIH